MAIADDFSITTGGDIRADVAFVPGTHARYSLLDLHAWLQDLADNQSVAGDDNVYAYTKNPSQIAGLRNTTRPTPLSLLNGHNIDDATSQWFKFGSVEQGVGNQLYTGLKVIGSLVASSPIYITQSAAKLTKYWEDADTASFQILVKAMTGGTLIDSGNIVAYSRKYGQTYSHFDVNLSAGSEQVAALSTAIDANVDTGVMTPAVCQGYFSTAIGGTATPGTEKIALAYGDTSQDMGDGNGSKLYKGTITLDGTITLSQAYQALMWACSESSPIDFNGTDGFQYRVLPGQEYAENIAAPFGTYAGGKWFVAQGWWLAGYQAADSKNFELVSDDDTQVVPPTSIAINIGKLVAGDYVVCARDDGLDYFDTDEYTVSGTVGAGTVSVTGLKSDTPASGVIRIDGDRYEYSSWSGTTVTLVGTLSQTYTNVSAFIPLIDDTAAGATIQSASMQFDANFTARYYVRRGIAGTSIRPFESTLSVTNAGGSGTAVRNEDE